MITRTEKELLDMKTTRYYRNPIEVDVVEVTAENIDEVAEWCKGTVVDNGRTKYIKVEVTNVVNERQTKAFPGDRVLYYDGTGLFKVYTPKAFEKSFSPVDVTTPPQELQVTGTPS